MKTMTHEEHIDLIRLRASELSPHKRWQDICNDLSALRGICMTFMVQLNAEYIDTIVERIPRATPTPQPKLTVDDL